MGQLMSRFEGSRSRFRERRNGGICAFTVAWERPNELSKVLSWVGSFTNIASGPTLRAGGHNYPAIIRKTPKKAIRVFLQDGENDLDNVQPRFGAVFDLFGNNSGEAVSSVDIDIDHHNNFNRNTSIDGGRGNLGDRSGGRQSWQHDASHRGGVNYRDSKTAQQFAQNPAVRNTVETAAHTGRQAATKAARLVTDKVGDRLPDLRRRGRSHHRSVLELPR